MRLTALPASEFYRRVVFCFLTGNGDAHVRNFAMLRDATHTVSLAPAYDLLNTQLHLPTESDMALSLRDRERDGHFSAAYDRFGFHTAGDFLDLAEAIGVRTSAANEITEHLCSDQALHQIVNLVDRSFLSVSSQRQYMAIVEERRAKLLAR